MAKGKRVRKVLTEEPRKPVHEIGFRYGQAVRHRPSMSVGWVAIYSDFYPLMLVDFGSDEDWLPVCEFTQIEGTK